MNKLIAILIRITLSSCLAFLCACPPKQKITRQTEGILRGDVYAEVTGKDRNPSQILLPDVTVTVKNAAGAVISETKSGLDGNYATNHLAFGKYELCLAKKDFIQSCYGVSVEYASNHPGPLKLAFDTEKYIWGSAMLKDGSPGYYRQDVFSVSIDTKILVETQAGPYGVRCNAYGEYVVPKVDPHAAGKVTAKCERAEDVKPLNGQKRVDLVFANSNPSINSITAYDQTGRSILRTSPGSKIKLAVAAADAEKDSLHYKWIPFGAFPSFVPADAPEAEWELPAGVNGRYEMDLMVFDRFGGVAYKSYSIFAGDGSVAFSGTVSNIDGSGKIPGALIRVNGQYAATADANGYFRCKVAGNGNDRYVLNIIKPGFSLCSRIYMTDAVQKDYRLVAATMEYFDPTQDIRITEKSDKYTILDRDQKARRSPALLFIPKNSIVDSAGNLVTAPVSVSIRSLDVTDANGQMPGNFGGNKNGQNVRLESYGATDVQIRDKANPDIKYSLSATAQAELSIPILPAQLASAGGSIPFWDYNETTGMWDPIGKLRKTGSYYKGVTNRFSVLNADFEFTSGTYIVLKDNPGNSVFNHAHPIIIKVFAPQAVGGVVQGGHIVDDLQPADIVSTQGILVVNLPANTVITVQVISNGTILNTLNPRTGPVIANSVGCCPPPTFLPPYDPTAVQVDLLPDNPILAPNQLNRFLTSESNPNGGQDAEKYYELIGASNYTKDADGNTVPAHRITFPEWKAKNGFHADGTGDVDAVYFNAGDLAFWRGMHQKGSAFYVSNFGNDVDAIFNNVLANNGDPSAAKTVAMEFTPVTSGINITKFYVFNANNELVNSANLDANNSGPDNGQKYVPGLCITCHGGSMNYAYTASVNTAADLQDYFTSHPDEIPNFLPFDAKSFNYSVASGNTRIDQEAKLRALNHQVLSNESPSTITRSKAIIDYINASYNNNPSPGGPGFIDNAVVDAGGSDTWNTHVPVNGVSPDNFYVDVVGTSCRTCHISRTNPAIWWDTKQKFINRKVSIQARICAANPNKSMPNSKVTFLNFWTSEGPKRYEELIGFLGITASCPVP